MCGGPHFQRECPNLGKGGPQYPISTAWTSWRPGSFPGPTLAQWNSWFPKPYKGKGKGKSKGKAEGGKGVKGKGKEQLSGLGPMPYWDENRCQSELAPLCATVCNVTDEDEQGWKTVKGRKETKAPIETQIMMKEVNSVGGTRFDVLEVTMNSEEDFLVLKAGVQNGAAKQASTIMKKLPKKSPQAKAKQEKRSGQGWPHCPDVHQDRALGQGRDAFPWWRQLPSSTESRGRRLRRQALHRAGQGAQGDLCERKSWQL